MSLQTCWETWDADGPRQNPLELPGNELVLVPMSECIRFYMMHGYAEVSHVCVHSRARARVCAVIRMRPRLRLAKARACEHRDILFREFESQVLWHVVWGKKQECK